MAINPVSSSFPMSLSLGGTTTQSRATAPANSTTTTPTASTSATSTAAADALLADLTNNSASSSDPLLAGNSASSDPLLADFSSDATDQSAAAQDTASLFTSLTGDPSGASGDPTQSDLAFFSQQLNVPVPAQQALNAYQNSQSMGGSSTQAAG